ncbi:4-oxalocrotonate tautomerase [Mucilaginibacter lappiensis]|uniref:4-oxalocrotonate tautomerase n=1 Tax=Mucilaginibacter lappiensis TaxID=354630 RepID=A0ABR6PJK3_9SPHI|nr:tautomerase family protein [Mucilaginibacter lappiensis]MBB6109155.1 4-oxalocrotonate tautomerase [Mucilaginibacter lappiensis]SIQ77832.1 4-oxalocrotonate tautomerase [Mucilaginibacter lappiensis]
MPIINLKVSGQEDPALAQELAKTISRLTKDILNKKPEVTVVTVTFVPDYLWFVNSVSLAQLKTKSFHLDIKISDSTNLKANKAKYIDAVHCSLASILGNIHPVSYTAIQEMKADAYGYEGLTIEYKYINNQKK